MSLENDLYRALVEHFGFERVQRYWRDSSQFRIEVESAELVPGWPAFDEDDHATPAPRPLAVVELRGNPAEYRGHDYKHPVVRVYCQDGRLSYGERGRTFDLRTAKGRIVQEVVRALAHNEDAARRRIAEWMHGDAARAKLEQTAALVEAERQRAVGLARQGLVEENPAAAKRIARALSRWVLERHATPAERGEEDSDGPARGVLDVDGDSDQGGAEALQAHGADGPAP